MAMDKYRKEKQGNTSTKDTRKRETCTLLSAFCQVLLDAMEFIWVQSMAELIPYGM